MTERFVRDFVFPMFEANAIYENLYLLSTNCAASHRQAPVEIARKRMLNTSAMARPARAMTKSALS